MECCFTQARELCRNNYATYNSNILITILSTFVTAVVLEQYRKAKGTDLADKHTARHWCWNIRRGPCTGPVLCTTRLPSAASRTSYQH